MDWVAGGLAAALVLVAGVGYDANAYASSFTPRAVLFFILSVAFVLSWLVGRHPFRRAFTFDRLDALAAAFVLWLVVSAAFSAFPSPAWFGAYNRGTGALFWILVVVLFVVGRRHLGSPRARGVVLWGASLTLVFAFIVALAQASGIVTSWGGEGFIEQGRMVGTTGNPVILGGLCLLSVWLGSSGALDTALGWYTRAAAIAGSVSGLVALVLSVSRSAYLGVAAGAIVLVVLVGLRRQWRRLGVVVGVCALVVLGAILYAPADAGSGGVFGRATTEATGDGAATGDAGAEGPALSESDQNRVELWTISLKALRERPLLGYGPGAFGSAFLRYVGADRLAVRPNNVATDAHDLPLMLGATGGIPLMILGAALFLGVAWSLGLGLRRGSGDNSVSPESGDSAAARSAAALCYLAACLAFLLVSPVDFAVLVPLALVSGLGVGAPRKDARLAWSDALSRSAGSLLSWTAVAMCTVVLVAAAVFGVRFWQADIASATAARTGDGGQALRAAELSPDVPRYATLAAMGLWRSTSGGVATKAADMVRAEGLLRRSLEADPSQPSARAELVRLLVQNERIDEAAAQCGEGLAFCPVHPILQALWGYSALVTLTEQGEAQAAATIAAGLASYSKKAADGWYWLSGYYSAAGDGAKSDEALARARELMPDLTPEDYRRRLTQGV